MSRRDTTLTDLCRHLAAYLEQHANASSEEIRHLLDSLTVLREESADPRLKRLGKKLAEIRQRAESLVETSCRDYLEPLANEAKTLAESRRRLLTSLMALSDTEGSAESFQANLLDQALAITGAERGFLLSYQPESTEADILAVREFASNHLSLEEYDFSRTILREILRGAGPLCIEDASADPSYSRERSVRRLRLRSVLAVPLLDHGRTLGAILPREQQAASRLHGGAPRPRGGSDARRRFLPAPDGPLADLGQAGVPRSGESAEGHRDARSGDARASGGRRAHC